MQEPDQPTGDRGTIFVVDDEAPVLDSSAMLLRLGGFHVHAFDSGAAFLSAYAPGPRDLAIFDIRMPNMDGLQLLAEVRARGWTLPVLLVSGHMDVDVQVGSLGPGVHGLVAKPWLPSELFRMIDDALAGR